MAAGRTFLGGSKASAPEDEVPGGPRGCNSHSWWSLLVGHFCPSGQHGDWHGDGGGGPLPEGGRRGGGNDGGRDGGWALSSGQAEPGAATMHVASCPPPPAACGHVPPAHGPSPAPPPWQRLPPHPSGTGGRSLARGHTGLAASSGPGLRVRSPLSLRESQMSPDCLPETGEHGKSVLPTRCPYGGAEAGCGDSGLGLPLAGVHVTGLLCPPELWLGPVPSLVPTRPSGCMGLWRWRRPGQEGGR